MRGNLAKQGVREEFEGDLEEIKRVKREMEGETRGE